jgi:hypothetical protein
MSKQKVLEVERGKEEWVVRFKPSEFHLLPTDTRAHVVAAGKEALMAVRSVLDSAITRMESPTDEKKTGPTPIKVE